MKNRAIEMLCWFCVVTAIVDITNQNTPIECTGNTVERGDDTESSLWFSFLENIDDDETRCMLEKRLQGLRCPGFDMCSQKTNISVPPAGKTFTCCSSCSCGKQCERVSTCCPAVSTELDNSYVVTQCLIPQWKKVFEKRLHRSLRQAYNFVAKCPASYDKKNTRILCERRNPLFNETKIEEIIPVTDYTSGIHYWNKHCANCHKIAKWTRIYWTPTLECKKVRLDFESFPDLLRKLHVQTSGDCNLKFKPHETFDHGKCPYIVSDCNETGEWRDYDEVIQKACLSHTGQYGNFKNLFCFLCNIPTVGLSVCSASSDHPIQSFTFSALLNFVSTAYHEDETSCPVGQFYDTSKRSCETILCSPLYQLEKNFCSPLLTNVPAKEYQMVLKFTPSEHVPTVDVETGNQLAQCVREFFFDFAGEQNILRGNFAVCGVGFAYKINGSRYSDLLEILAFIDVCLCVNHDPYQLSTNLFTLTNLTCMVFGVEFKTKFINSDYTAFALLKEFEYNITSAMNRDFREDQNSARSTGHFGTSGVVCEDGHTILPYIQEADTCSFQENLKTKPIILSEVKSCAMTLLSSESLYWQEKDDSLFFPKLNFTLAMNFYYFPNTKKSTILICIQNYLAIIDLSLLDVDQRHPNYITQNVEVVVSIVVTTLSLTSLVITLIIYGLLSDLRTLQGQLIIALIITLCFAQSLYIVFIISGVYAFVDWLCKLIGILLHFFWLSTMLWMNVCTYDVHRVLTKIENSAYRSSSTGKLLSYTAYVVLISGCFVVINIVYSLQSTDMTDIGYGKGICYISTPRMIGYLFGVPVGIVIVTNVVMFLRTVFNLLRTASSHPSIQNHRNDVIIFAKLSTLTGLMWIFGFIYQWTQIKVFSYLFILLNAGQGILIMLSFVCNRRSRNLLRVRLCGTGEDVATVVSNRTDTTKTS